MSMNRWKISGAVTIPKRRSLTLYEQFEVFKICLAAVLGVTGSCWHTWAKFKVVEPLPLSIWIKAYIAQESGYPEFRDALLILLRLSPQRRN